MLNFVKSLFFFVQLVLRVRGAADTKYQKQIKKEYVLARGHAVA
jgi:hypothetical protein